MAFFYVALLSIALGASSCEHDEELEGPNLIDRFGPFTNLVSLTASRDSVDFANGENVQFTAEFNKNVSWIITITGDESGAVQRIEGLSAVVEATWNGRVTELPFFKTEPCSVTLTVPEEGDFTDSTSVVVKSGRIYPGYLLADFEQADPANVIVRNFEFELDNVSGRSTLVPAVQGDFSLLLQGTDGSNPNFFVGLVEISSAITGTTYLEPPTTVPSSLYFNFFLYNDGRPHGICVIQFAFDSNDNGVFDDGIDATFQVPGDFPLNFTGIRKFSHPMTDVKTGGENGTSITQAQLQKIVAVRVLLISNMNDQPSPPLPVQFGIDYMIFTQGAPLAL